MNKSSNNSADRLNSRKYATNLAIRLASFYGAIFLLVGIILPFFPVWLKSRGLGDVEISFILAGPLLSRVIFTPIISFLADHLGDRRRVLIGLTWGSFFSLLAFIPLQGFWSLLMVSIIFGIFWTSVMPLTESIAMSVVKKEGLDYGRIRLWGSLSFIIASLVGGIIIDFWGDTVILYMMLATLLISILSAYALPVGTNNNKGEQAPSLPPIHWLEALSLMRSKLFILFLMSSAGIQATHAIYYGFGTLHWQSLGISAGIIGALWAVGVIAEVTLFGWSKPLLDRFGPTRLLVFAALGALVRWTITAFDPPLVILFPVQILHALSFGAAHLGAIHFISQAIPEHLSATGQGLYAAFAMGIIMGIMTMIAGTFYASLGSYSYLVMSALALASLIGAIALNQQWQGEQIIDNGKL